MIKVYRFRIFTLAIAPPHLPPPPNDFRRFLGSRSCNSIFLYEIEPDEIIKIISGFNNNKSSDLCVRAIKHARHEIAPVLTQLFNDCMYSGIFPDELKIAKVIPLFKSGKRHDLSNYRPISILPLFSKIFEKLIHVSIAEKGLDVKLSGGNVIPSLNGSI